MNNQTFDLSDNIQLKLKKFGKKNLNLTCVICNDQAIGFNYGIISCSSCKAFFRRNAHKYPEQLRCVIGNGRCYVDRDIHRKCQRCRLEKCLNMGMNKNLMRSEQKKLQRKNPSNEHLLFSEANHEFNHFLSDMDKDESENELLRNLSADECLSIQNVHLSFLSTFKNQNIQYSSHIDVTNLISALISWSTFANEIALNFIKFFRQIDEFEYLNNDDRFILIKYNLFSLFIIFKCFNYNSLDDCCSNIENENTKKSRQFFMLCDESNDIHDELTNLIRSLVQITEQDSILISLLLVNLILSKGLSMSEYEPSLKDSLAVNKAQSYYTKLLWNYMVNKHGELYACKQFIKILSKIFKIQIEAKKFRDLLCFQYTLSDTLDKITPLVYAVLYIN